MTQLRISPTLTLPVDAVTRSFGFLGMRGSGKSNAAVVLAEEMFRGGLRWVVIDPAAAWWGIRSSIEGEKNGGLPVVIFGGEHADIPLEPTAAAGVLVADVILNENISAVLDLSQMTKGQKIAFLVGPGNTPEGFAQRLYRKKKQDDEPMHIFLEEAHDYVPKLARNEVGKLVEAVSNFQTIGRGRGFGCSILSQRSARVHNDVLSQIDTLFAFRTVGPHDKKAIEAWVSDHDVDRELVKSLPDLKDGESWLFSPEWLGRLERLTWRRRSTYDSGATPKVGQAKRKPATLADVNIPAVNAAMAETIERSKAEDPRELRKRIRELEQLMSDSQKHSVTASVDNRREEELERDLRLLNEALPALRDDLERSERRRAVMVEQSQGIYDRLQTLFEDFCRVIALGGQAAGDLPTADQVKGILGGKPTSREQHGRHVRSATSAETGVRALPPAPNQAPITPAPEIRSAANSGVVSQSPGEDVRLGKPHRAILDALAGYPKGLTREQLAFLAEYHPRSKGFINAMGTLRTAGLVSADYPATATPAGRALSDGRPTADLFEHWASRFGRGERAILETLIASYPNAGEREPLAAAAGYEHVRSKGFINSLGRLRGLGLVDGLRLSDDFAQLLELRR